MYRSYTKNRNGRRKTLVPVNFTRDHYLRIMHHLYASSRPDASRTRLMLQLATSAVARGEEIRDVLLSNLALEHIDIIGEGVKLPDKPTGPVAAVTHLVASSSCCQPD